MKTALFVLVALVGGCYHVTVRTGKNPSNVVQEQTAHMFLYGLVGSDLQAPCDAAIVETEESVGDWLLAVLTGGLYTPYEVTTTCAAR